MSDPAPPSRLLGGGDPESDTGEGNPVLRTLKRVRAFLVLVPLVVGLLVAAGIGAEKLWADLPERTAVGPDVTCWDGRTAPAIECTSPRGLRGLQWVFPSFQPRDERCVLQRTSTNRRPYDVACSLRFDQRPVTVTYALRGDADALVEAVRTAYGTRPTGEADGDRLVFRSNRPDDEGRYRVTVVYAEHPYAVTVQAPDRRVRDTALAELVSFRPASQVLVR